MVFSSLPFLYYFLPVLLLCYFIIPDRAKNYVLLLFSLIFYTVGEPTYIVLMLFSIAQAYVFALLVSGSDKTGTRRLFLIITLLLELLPLLICKYSGFIVSNLNLAAGLSIPIPSIRLPVGISFYTFQLIGYSVDVYRKRCDAQKNPLTLALYVSLFPQLIAGPIVRYSDVCEQLSDRVHSIGKFSDGIVRFTVGMSKKVLIANTLGELCKNLGGSVLGTWGYAVAASLQIYYDFSGYSDMAIGLGHMFGFDFPENFNYPYISGSVSEFWRRWHMTLGSWFRDYVYIPMGGNRVSKPRWILNILTVWMLTGLWHGAEWTFVIWGLYFAVFLVLEKLLSPITSRLPAAIRHVGVLFIVMVSFMIFDAGTITEAVSEIGTLFGIGTADAVDPTSAYYLKSYAATLLIAAIGSTPLPKILYDKLLSAHSAGVRVGGYVFSTIIVMSALVISTAYLVDGSYNPFLYFRF